MALTSQDQALTSKDQGSTSRDQGLTSKRQALASAGSSKKTGSSTRNLGSVSAIASACCRRATGGLSKDGTPTTKVVGGLPAATGGRTVGATERGGRAWAFERRKANIGNAVGCVGPIAGGGAAVPGANRSAAEASSSAGRQQTPARAAARPKSRTAGAAAKTPATGTFKSGGESLATAAAEKKEHRRRRKERAAAETAAEWEAAEAAAKAKAEEEAAAAARKAAERAAAAREAERAEHQRCVVREFHKLRRAGEANAADALEGHGGAAAAGFRCCAAWGLRSLVRIVSYRRHAFSFLAFREGVGATLRWLLLVCLHALSGPVGGVGDILQLAGSSASRYGNARLPRHFLSLPASRVPELGSTCAPPPFFSHSYFFFPRTISDLANCGASFL